jgi:23S rRNA (adenine2503-C2)-methyltransferase
VIPPRVPRVSLPRAPSRGGELLASHDAGSLAALLVDCAGGAVSTARATAAKVLRHAHRPATAKATGVPAWDDAALAAIGVGAWARPALLRLDPSPSLAVAEEAPSADDTVRLALRARDGALIETVIIPGPGRTTVCLSSQVGCARACSFCETGRHGLDRQLDTGEIIDQVRLASVLWRARVARSSTTVGAAPISNLVFMGMGEPFDNLGEVTRAVRLLTDPRAFGFAARRVTVSTVGVADKLDAFFAGCQAELAVSLNAPDDARRDAIMPVNRRVPLAALRAALAQSLPPRRRVLFEYVVFDGFNDAPEDADLVAGFVSGLRCRVNVIPCNPGPDPALRPPAPPRLDAFVARLSRHGVTTLVRRPRGRDVGGACGQLAGALRSRDALG